MKHLPFFFFLSCSRTLALFFLLLFPLPWAGARVVPDGNGITYVRQGGTGNGSSWANASSNLQAAVDAPGVQQVWVAAGTYKPTTGTDPSISFVMKNDVAIYGGFPATGTPGFSDRDWTAHVTTLSGDIGTPDINSLRVISNSGLDSTAILDGFVITDGGGMYNSNSSPTLSNCVFSGNSANDGGGMLNNSSSPSLTNCTFSGNSAVGGGGFLDLGLGGGMYNYASSPSLTKCIFSGNSAAGGGGMYNEGSSPSLANCVFSGNSIGGGGGMLNLNSSSPTLTNCVFSGNLGSFGAGGMWNISSSPSLTNCTFSGNSAVSGGGMGNSSSSPSLTNCILWGNSSEFLNDTTSSPTVTYSIVQGGYPGTGNLDKDPLFVLQPDTAAAPTTVGDLRLQPCSPAIDAGDDAANSTTTDPDGNARKVDAIPGGAKIDMGAYEAPALPAPTVSASGPTSLCPGQSVTLTASNVCVGCTVNWSNGQSGPAITVSVAGNYTATVHDFCSTSPASNAIAVTTVAAPTTPTVSASGPTSLCPGQSVTLTATNICAGCTVNWSTGQSGASIVVSAVGQYSATYTNDCGSGLASAGIAVTMSDPFVPVVQENMCLLAAPPGSGYQWFLNGVAILGATGQFWPADTTGYYTVTMTNLTGCVGTSNPEFVDCSVGTEAPTWLHSLRLFPNPANDFFTLHLEGEPRQDILVELLSSTSQTVFRESLDFQSGSLLKNYSCRDVPAGMYLVRVSDFRGSVFRKIIIE